MSEITLEERRDAAAILAAAVALDTERFELLAAGLDDQQLHDRLMSAVGCAAHCMRGTEAEQRLADVIAGAASQDE